MVEDEFDRGVTDLELRAPGECIRESEDLPDEKAFLHRISELRKSDVNLWLMCVLSFVPEKRRTREHFHRA